MVHRTFLFQVLLVVGLGAVGLLISGTPQSARAQGVGPLRLEAEMFGAAGTGERLPFWLTANQYGTVDPASANAGLQVGAHRPFAEPSGFDYAFGAEVLGRASQNGTVTVHELYGRLQYWTLQLTAGRREQITGRVDTSLSLGSVTRSRNAPPVPRITLSSDGYVPVPGTAGGLALKGSLTHGWLEGDRFVRDAFVHEKSLYLRLLPPDFLVTAHAGITHHAQWGGTSALSGPLDSSFGEWVAVLFSSDVLSREPTDDVTVGTVGANHIAMYDFSLNVDLGGWRGLAYRQFFHEDIASFWFRNVWDGLWGVSLRRDDESAFVSAVLWEHLRMTRHNARFSAGETRGADTYYNHGNYRGGWTYQGRTLGIPLLTPASSTPGLRGDLPGIGNNIVVAHHVGVEGHLGAGLSYQALGTYSRNYGAGGVCQAAACETRGDERTDRRDQWSFRVRVGGPLSERHGLRVHAAVALDTGEFYDDRVGIHLGLQWRGVYGPDAMPTSR